MLVPYLHYAPALQVPYDLAATSAVAGRVKAGPGLTLRDCATLRADGEAIRIGRDAYFAERATVHIVDSLLPAVLGDRATVGRFALVHACTLGDDVVVGDAAVVMDGAEVGSGALIAPGALVAPRKKLDGGALYAGNPAVRVRDIDRAELAAAARAIREGAALPLVRDDDLPPLDNRPYQAATAEAPPPSASNPKAFVAPTSALRGNVALADDSGVYFACAVVAGGAIVSIGEGTNVQDNALLVTDAARGDLAIGRAVTIGHNVRIGAGSIGDDALIGMGAQLGDGVVVEAGACVGGRALVLPGTVVRSGWIWAGRPAKAFREIRPQDRAGFARAAEVYVNYTRNYRAG
jgi:carbonic anhydrase/acetyltransferase-like protein (isoleucine patch superfamily)